MIRTAKDLDINTDNEKFVTVMQTVAITMTVMVQSEAEYFVLAPC